MAEGDDRQGQRDWGGDTAALGGYGSAGLYSRRRQMERTQGGSYQNLSNITRTQARGGYASMPGEGPAPVVTTPMVSGHTGSLGPTSMAQGVSGDFSGNVPQVPNWGQTSTLLGAAAGAAGIAAGKKLANAKIYRNPLSDEERGSGQKWVTRQSRKDLKAYKNTKATEDPWVQSERDLDEGVMRVLSPEEQSQRITIGGRSLRRPGTYDPSLGWSGTDMDEWNLALGIPSQSAIGELPRPKNRMDTGQGVTPVDVSRIPGTMRVTGEGARRPRPSGPIAGGQAPAFGELEGPTPSAEAQWRNEPLGRNQYASDDIATQRRVVSPETGRSATVTGPIPVATVAEESVGYEYPGYNARLGDNPQPRKRPTTRSGRRGLAAEREATRDPNQYSLFDPNQ